MLSKVLDVTIVQQLQAAECKQYSYKAEVSKWNAKVERLQI